MRQARNSEILLVDGKLIGINLGADYVSEHEWGIDTIRSYFKIDKSKLGLEGKKIAFVPSNMIWLTDLKLGYNPKDKSLWSGIYFGSDPEEPRLNATAFNIDLVTAWSEKDFAAVSNNPDKVASIKEVFEAFNQLDIAMWIGGGGVFQNGGLCFGIVSRLPKSITDNWLKSDEDRIKLKADAEATGIEKLLKDAGKQWFALSPTRMRDGSITFWLNPMDQARNNYGQYTLQDLKDWAQNKGPIPKR